MVSSKPTGVEGRVVSDEAGRVGDTPDRSMRALLLDEEAGQVAEESDRPLRLVREGAMGTEAGAPPPRSAEAEKGAKAPAGPQGSTRPAPPPAAAKGSVPAPGAPARVEVTSAGGARGAPGVAGAPGSAARTSPMVPAAVIPGVGPVKPGHVGAVAGLVHGAASHVLGQQRAPADGKHQQIAAWAQQEPARYGADFLLYGHNRKRYEELARAGRLPSQVWAEYEANGQLERLLLALHERHGEQLRRVYRERPFGERVVLGLGAASGSAEDIARALDALRVHPHYPARVSFARLVHGFSPAEIARIAAAFLPGHGGGSVVEVFRAVREARERAFIERRRRLLRRLREHWASEQPAIVPLFEVITRGFSPAQAEMLRRELERSGDVEAVFEQIEIDNLRHRLDAVEAAFRRWLAEWEASREPGVQTPMQEPQGVLEVRRLVRPIPVSFAASAGVEAAVIKPAVVEPAVVEPAAVESALDGQRRLALQRALDDAPPPADLELDGGDMAAADTDEEQGLDEAGAPPALRAPPPGAHAADGILPWHHLSQGLGRGAEERLCRAWEEGRPWEVYRELLARRGEALLAAREAAFVRRLEELGCRWPGPCRIGREQLAALGPLGASLAPEQWTRLTEALTEGSADPLEVWREIERENLIEAVSVREPALLRYMGAWGQAPRWNPLEWSRTAPQLGRVLLDQEAAGLVDDLQAALGSDAGRRLLSTMGQGIGALFGGAGGAGQGGVEGLGGKLRSFAEQAVGALTGRKTPTRPNAGQGEAASVEAASVEVAGAETADGEAGAEVGDVLSAVDQSLGKLVDGAANAAKMRPGDAQPDAQRDVQRDVQRAVAQWAGLHRQFGERVVRGLAGVGLHDLAGAAPKDLVAVIAGRAPKDSDPSGWWRELTTGQGLDDAAESLLRRTIDADGPEGIEHTIGAYMRLLEDAARAQKERREALFMQILAAAQRAAGRSFDPGRLPGGDPFELLSQHTNGWRRVADAMKRGGDPLAVFRQVENARLRRLLQVDAPAWMGDMLFALWEQREGAGWVPDDDAGEPEDAAAPDGPPPGHQSHQGPPPGHQGPSGHQGPPPGHQGPRPGYQPGYPPGYQGPRPGHHPGYQPGHHPGYQPGYPPGYRGPRPGYPYPREPGRVVVREPVRRPVRVHDPFYELPWWRRRVHHPAARWPFWTFMGGVDQRMSLPFVRYPVRYVRPRPLYHLSFGRQMSQRELRRLLMFVPQLRAHPHGVLAEMAGLVGQARDVRGVDATTGEYLLVPGETLADVAFKLVGTRSRWRELLAANPLRVDGDPRVRLPPSWFGYVPYSVPLHRVHNVFAWRRHHAETGDPEVGDLEVGDPEVGDPEVGDPEDVGDLDDVGEEVGDGDDAGDLDDAGDPEAGDLDAAGEEVGDIDAAGDVDEAGYVRRRFVRRPWQRRGHQRRWWPASGGMFRPGFEEEELEGDPEADAAFPGEAGAPSGAPPHRYVVARGDVRTPNSPDHTREAAEAIAVRHGLWDGERWVRPGWWLELRDVNPQKPLGPDGWWRDIHQGEVLWIPGGWPVLRQRPAPEMSDTGAVDEGVKRQNITTRTYAVVAGDGMQRIAQKLGAAARPHWFGELRDANPHKKMLRDDKGRQLRWQSLAPGEIVNIPDVWPDTPQLRPAPGGTPTPAPYPGLSQFPAVPGGAVPSPTAPPGTVPAAATVDPGTILRVQAILIAFRQLHPEAIVPKDFGAGMPFSPDATGVLTPRTQQALASFQRWSNAATGSRLRTDGVLDPDTIAALDSFSAQALGGLPQRPPAKPAAGARSDGERRPAPAAIEAPDPFAGLFQAAGDFLPDMPDMPPAPRPPVPSAPSRRPPPRAPVPPLPSAPVSPVLHELPETLEQYGIPGVPGLPSGAPHAPKPRPPRADVAPPAGPSALDAPREAQPGAPDPAAKKKSSDDAVVPVVLTGLGILSGFFA